MIFIHPAFLWGLLAVLIPVAVHLFNFRRYRKVYFSNVERLSELQTESRRQNTLRQWLVLAARILAVAALVLAFAHPVIRSKAPRAVLDGNVAVSIYIDNSFSMESASSDGSLLDLARQKAREVAETYGMDVRYQLLTCDMAGHEMRWLSRDELMEAIDGVEPSAAAPLLSVVVQRQSDFLRQGGASARHAYLISDFQQSTADLGTLPADSTILFTLVPLSGVEADNVYIDTLMLDAPAYFAGGAVNVEVSLRNCGNRAVERVPLKLYIDGQERAMTTLDIGADATASATLRFVIDHAGWHDGRVEVEDYPVTFDDSYYFCLLAGERIEMVEVDASQPNESLRKLFSHDSAVSYHSERHLPPVLAPCHFVVLNELPTLTSGEMQQLAEWVADGGNLLVIPPAPTSDLQSLNILLSALQAPQLGRWVQQPLRVTAIDYTSSLYRSVFAGKTDDMELPTTQGHYTLSSQSSIRQAVITLADGADMLTVTPVGNGRLYLFTLPMNDVWSDFPTQALFVPTLYNMALYSRPLPAAAHTLGGSDPIVLQGSYGITPPPDLRLPAFDFQIIPDLRQVGNKQLLVLHGEMTAAGIYRLADEHLAFNYPRRESELRYLTRDEVAQAVAGREEYSVVRNSQKPLANELRERDGGRPLWRLCLLLTLLMLAAEILLLKMKK